MNGARVGITGTRRAKAQHSLVTTLGGVPVHGACVDIDTPAPDAVIDDIVRALLAAPPDIVVFVTGVGARHVLDRARRTGSLDALLAVLRGARVIARGGKPRRVLREFAVPVEWTAAPAESRVIAERLVAEGVAGRRVVVQCAGVHPDVMVAPLRAAGADVATAHPYDLDVPPDAHAGAALALATAGGGIEALTFTSAHAVHGFVAIAERVGLDVPGVVHAGTLVVAVGPVTRAALLHHGLPVHVEPVIPRMGAMFHELAAALAGGERGSVVRPRAAT